MIYEDFTIDNLKDISKVLVGKFNLPKITKDVMSKYNAEYVDAFAAVLTAIAVKKAYDIINEELKHLDEIIDGRKKEVIDVRVKAN
tara:strand:+ start:685 stop:942 length:258 start_codon:yes stop_codon:yes gene_type:complete